MIVRKSKRAKWVITHLGLVLKFSTKTAVVLTNPEPGKYILYRPPKIGSERMAHVKNLLKFYHENLEDFRNLTIEYMNYKELQRFSAELIIKSMMPTGEKIPSSYAWNLWGNPYKLKYIEQQEHQLTKKQRIKRILEK